MRVSPSENNPTHHIKLSYGGTDVGLVLCDSAGNADLRGWQRSPYPRSSLKMYSGDQRYADLEPPFTPMAQTDWSGGRGIEIAEEDARRYYDGFNVDTLRPEQVYLAGQLTLGHGFVGGVRHWPWRAPAGTARTLKFIDLGGSGKTYLAAQFTPAASFQLQRAFVYVRYKGAPNAALNVGVWSDVAGAPGVAAQTLTISTTQLEKYLAAPVQPAAFSLALTGGTAYWLVFSWSGSDTAVNGWELLASNSGYGGAQKYSVDGLAWTAGPDETPFYWLGALPVQARTFYFEYKRALYAAQALDDGSASTLYINGEQGTATGGTTASLIDAAKSWVTDEWKGCAVLLVSGTGSEQDVNWATITGNTGTTLSFAVMQVAPAAGTEYVILGSEKWAAVTGHTWTNKRITDVLVHRDVVYFALGDGSDLQRMRRFTSGGAWTSEWVTEAGNKFHFLAAAPNGNGSEVWGGSRSTPATIKKATSVDGSGSGAISNLTFGSAISLQDTGDRITNLLPYGEQGYLWVLKEGALIQIERSGATDVPAELIIGEMHQAKDARNGAAAIVAGVYLWFSFLEGLEKYYNGSLDDVGPNREAGLPSGRRGYVASLAGYPGRLFAAVDAGASGESSVLCWSGNGWHEVVRVPDDLRASAVYCQAIPGQVDRLWVGAAGYLMWAPLSLNPMAEAVYPFAGDGGLVSAWFYGGLVNVDKYWNAIGATLVDDVGVVEVDYQQNEADAWTRAGVLTRAAPELDLSGVSGAKLRWRLRLRAHNTTSSPRVRAVIVEGVARAPVKYADTLTFRAARKVQDLVGEWDGQVGETMLAQLESWAAMAAPVVVGCISSRLNGKSAFVEPASVRVLDVVRDGATGEERMVCQVQLVEV